MRVSRSWYGCFEAFEDLSRLEVLFLQIQIPSAKITAIWGSRFFWGHNIKYCNFKVFELLIQNLSCVNSKMKLHLKKKYADL